MPHIIGDKRPRLELRRTNNSNGIAISLQGNVSSLSELSYDAIRKDEIFKEAFLDIVLYYIDAIKKDNPNVNTNKEEKKVNN